MLHKVLPMEQVARDIVRWKYCEVKSQPEGPIVRSKHPLDFTMASFGVFVLLEKY